MWLLLSVCLLFAPAILANPIDEFQLESNASCSEAEKEKATEDATGCGKNAMAELDQPLCRRVDHFVNGCMDQHLKKCFNATYIRLYKDSMIVIASDLLKQTGHRDMFNECEVVKEFFESKRNVYRPSATCTPEQVRAAEEHRQECIKGKNAALQRRISDALSISNSEFQEMLCRFIEEAIVNCNNVFRECYNDDEMKEIKKTNYEVLIKLLEKEGLKGIDLEKCSENPAISEVISGSS